MNHALSELAAQVGLLKLEDPGAVRCLGVLREFVAGRADAAALNAATGEISQIANGHRGSNSIDGSAHAAVSATYATANALAGKALDAASYAAYASVYAYGGYAISDPSAFEVEFAWQVEQLQKLAAGPTDDSVGSPLAAAEFQR